LTRGARESRSHGDRLLPGRLEAAFRFGQPEIWNSDQGPQFTSADFLAPLKKRGISITMDGRALGNVFIERLWRSPDGFGLAFPRLPVQNFAQTMGSTPEVGTDKV